MRTIILALTSLALTLVASAGEPAIDRLLRGIRAELPKGWSASYDKEYAWLEVSRDEAVFVALTGPNSSPGLPPWRTQFAIGFRVKPIVLPEEYRRWSAENLQIQKKANALYDELKKRGLQQKFDSFGWKTEDDKKTVARYEALKKSLHWLPDFYFGDICLWWVFNSPEQPGIDVIDVRIGEECAKVQENVVKLLSKYELPKP